MCLLTFLIGIVIGLIIMAHMKGEEIRMLKMFLLKWEDRTKDARQRLGIMTDKYINLLSQRQYEPRTKTKGNKV